MLARNRLRCVSFCLHPGPLGPIAPPPLFAARPGPNGGLGGPNGNGDDEEDVPVEEEEESEGLAAPVELLELELELLELLELLLLELLLLELLLLLLLLDFGLVLLAHALILEYSRSADDR